MNILNVYYLSLKNTGKYFQHNLANKNVFWSRLTWLKWLKIGILKTIIWKVFCYFEPILSVIIVSFQLVPYIIKSFLTRHQPIGDMLYIDNCPLLKKRTMSAGLYDSSVDWLYSLSIPKSNWDIGKRCHSIFEYVSLMDVLKSYVLSIVAIIGTSFKVKFKYVMGTFSCMEFFLTHFFLENISEDVTLCFCNQVDRWAVLFDRSHQKNKILFQHGIEMPSADWPVKFEHTNTVYALSKKEADYLFHAVFNKLPENVKIMNPTINLEPINIKEKLSVLIVGYPSYGLYEKESYLIEKLQSDDILVYFKPHPGKMEITKYDELAKTNKVVILKEQLFPDVSFVVSYRSTLAVEYEVYDKIVLFYEEHPVDEIVDIIQRSL